jgi:hypothetical protein
MCHLCSGAGKRRYAHMAIRVKLDEIIDGLEALYGLIKGSGAFRRFKDAVHHYGLADDWYKYRDNTLRQIAIDWCQENNVEFSEQ